MSSDPAATMPKYGETAEPFQSGGARRRLRKQSKSTTGGSRRRVRRQHSTRHQSRRHQSRRHQSRRQQSRRR